MYKKSLAIYALIALLALTPLLIAIPTKPVLAAVKEPTVSIDYPYMVINDTGTRTITVENPLGNPDIKEIRVYVPAEAADNVKYANCSGFVPGTNFTVVGAGPWTMVSRLPEGFDFILPDGGTGKIKVNIDSEDAETTDGVVDKYELTVTIKFVDGTTVTKKLYLYEGAADKIVLTLEYTAPVKAGDQVTIKVSTYSTKTGYTKADKGLPLVIWGEYKEDTETKQVKIAEVVTDADGKASATYTPTKAVKWTFKADAVMDAPTNIGAQLKPGEGSLTVKPGAPTKVVVKTPFDEEGYTISYLIKDAFNITVSVTDKYDNPVEMEVTATATLTATKGTLVNTTTTIPKGYNESLPVVYKPDPLWGTYAMISAKVSVPSGNYTGTYSGTSKSLRTSTFATKNTTKITVSKVEVEAGKYVTITVTLSPAQEGVPVKFNVTAEDYTGKFSPVSTTTDEYGNATTRFYVDTEAGKTTTVKAIISAPTTEDPTATFEVGSAEIKTVPGAIYKLGIDAPEAVEPEGTATLTIYLADKYDNEVESNLFSAVIRVTLSATGGELEETVVDIPADKTNTTVEWTAPKVLGTYTITASTTQYGLASASVKIMVTTLEPIVNITQPATDTTIKTTANVTTVYIAGWAKPSPAAASGTVISLFKYRLGTGANVSVPIVSIEDSKAFFNFSLTLEVGKTYTVTVYAIDSAGYESKATRTITVAYAPAPPVMPVTVSNASTDKPSYKSGEEVKITGTVTNNATVAKTVIIRVTFIDPNGVPQYPIVELKLTLAAGQSITPTATYLAGAVKGVWTAKIMVVDAVTGEAVAEPITIKVTVV